MDHHRITTDIQSRRYHDVRIIIGRFGVMPRQDTDGLGRQFRTGILGSPEHRFHDPAQTAGCHHVPGPGEFGPQLLGYLQMPFTLDLRVSDDPDDSLPQVITSR